MRPRRSESGLATVELVVSAVLLITLVLLIAGFGLAGADRQRLERAAGAAARVGTFETSAAAAREAAETAARDSLTDSGAHCRRLTVEVDVSQFGPGGQLGVRLTCVLDLARFSLAGFGSTTLHARGLAPIEAHRAVEPTP
jgi:Flp pilus assembly protein TadG